MAFNVGGATSGAVQGASAGSALGPWGALGGGIIGGLAGGFSDSGEGGRDAEFARNFAQQQLNFQQDLAAQGIRWRVADAKAAGLHPLAALGMQPWGGQTVGFAGSGDHGDDLSWLSQAGQNIGRAIDSTRTKGERVETRVDALRVTNMELQNDILRAQLAKLNAAQVGPPFPDPANPGVNLHGTADATPLVKENPLERNAAAPGHPSQEAGAVSDYGFARTPTGFAVLPSKDFKDRGEDQIIPEVMWALRNQLLPEFLGGARNAPPDSWLSAFPGAYRWRFNPLKGEWQPDYRSPEEFHGSPKFGDTRAFRSYNRFNTGRR